MSKLKMSNLDIWKLEFYLKFDICNLKLKKGIYVT